MALKVCIARVDRIGDLILTLPCGTFWKSARPDDEIVWLVPASLKFVVEHVDPAPRAIYLEMPAKGIVTELRAALKLSRDLKREKIDEVLAIHVPWWVALAFWRAGVAKRFGVASQWFSWLFFNGRLRQKRSQALKHESEYNFELAAFALGLQKAPAIEPVRLKPQSELVQKWRDFLRGRGAECERLVVIHPGMAGSARNWPEENYRDLAVRLLARGLSVVVTGGGGDREFVEATGILKVSGVVNAVGETTGPDLLALLSLAKAVVAPSTGVAHLAASLGVPVAGIYSPVKVQAPLRWRPLGPSVKVFVPEIPCPGRFRCLGRSCPHYDCMTQIPVESVATYVMDKL